MNLVTNTCNVVVDASVMVGLCAREPGRHDVASAVLREHWDAGHVLHAPHLAIMECAFAICRKMAFGTLSPGQHAAALQRLRTWPQMVEPPQGGDASLLADAERIRGD